MAHTIFKQSSNLQRWSFIYMEVIEDEDLHPRNMAPLNKSHIIELSDGSDDDDPCLPLEMVDDNDDSDEEDGNEEEIEDAKESAEAELGQ